MPIERHLTEPDFINDQQYDSSPLHKTSSTVEMTCSMRKAK